MLNTRVTVQFRFAIAALALLVVTNLMGCKADSNYFSAANASVGGGDGASADVKVGFRVRLKAKDGVDGFIHKFNDIAAPCEVPLDSLATPHSIQCMANMMEYDLWFYGLEYEVNVPAGACSFLAEMPYSYYTQEPGAGPTQMSIDTTDGAITACTIGGQAPSGGFTSGTCVGAEATIKGNGDVTCAYDHSLDATVGPLGGKNCCVGTGQLTIRATVNSGSPPAPVTTTNVKTIQYGTTVDQCTESPFDYVDEWPKTSVSKIAVGRITQLGVGGLLRSQKVPSPMTLRTAARRENPYGNFLTSGFHDWGAYQTGNWDTNRVIPRAFIPAYDRGNDGTHNPVVAQTTALPRSRDRLGDGAYDFQCLGGAGEIKQRIRMYVNEWNTIEDYVSFKTVGDPTVVDPDRVGVSGSDCSSVNTGYSCNSIWGWDDIINDTYYATGGTMSGHGVKGAYVFPNEGVRRDPY